MGRDREIEERRKFDRKRDERQECREVIEREGEGNWDFDNYLYQS